MTDDDVIEINQKWAPGLEVQLRLVNGRTLCIEKKGKRTQKYVIDLLALGEEGKRKIIIGWQWAVAGAAAILLATIAILFVPVLEESLLYTGLVSLVSLAASGGCFFMAWKATSRQQIFFSRNANIPLVELAIDNPSKKEFNFFIRKVEQCIVSSREGLVISKKNQLAGEMKMLRRLSEEGVISVPVYKKARSGLLNQH